LDWLGFKGPLPKFLLEGGKQERKAGLDLFGFFSPRIPWVLKRQVGLVNQDWFWYQKKQKDIPGVYQIPKGFKQGYKEVGFKTLKRV